MFQLSLVDPYKAYMHNTSIFLDFITNKQMLQRNGQTILGEGLDGLEPISHKNSQPLKELCVNGWWLESTILKGK